MTDRFVRERWLAGSLLLSCVLLFLAGTLDAAISKPAPAPDTADGKLRIICFGAHPDDNEFKAGGVAAMWAAQGHHVKFVSTTNGDIGHWGMAGGPLAQVRTAEVERCAEIFGIETEVLDIHDGEIMPTLENRRTIVRLIREWRADIVMCHRPNDYHPDHRYTAILVQDAGYMVTVPFFCPNVPYLRRNPVFLFYQDRFQKPNPFAADIAVGIDAVIDKKLDAALALASQTLEGGCNGNERLYPENDPDKRKAREQEVRQRFDRRFASTANQFREQLNGWYGQERAGKIKYAEVFEICEYGRRPSKQEIRKLFPFFPNP
ncbi:MAG TPA: GlcNAc-PI de-N-acetylase [Phycisphaerales bacterium]|nr:GlcNAc-PI de-N-acetylase [Phycisphaerales bacterium]